MLATHKGYARAPLKVEPQRQLDLTVRTDTDLVGHGRVQCTEVRAGRRGRERLTGLDARAGTVRDTLRQAQIARVGEVRAVEDVVELRAEFDVLLLSDPELLAEGDVELLQAGARQTVAHRVAEAARRRQRERCRV